MPKVLEQNGYKFRFYSNENKEKAHVHVSKGNGLAKFWLEPEIKEEYSYGFTVRERRDMRLLIKKNHSILIKKWYAHFGDKK